MAQMISGLTMQLLNHSRAASGAEHLMAHLVEMKPPRFENAHGMHGQCVGVGTYLCAKEYHYLASLPTPKAKPFEPLTRACDYCGVVSGREVDKFAKTGLTPLAVEGVSAPGIAESPVNIACRVVEERALGSHTMFLAEVVGVTADEKYMDETGRFDINGTGLIMYSHGEYFGLGRKLGKFGYSVQKKKSRRRAK